MSSVTEKSAEVQLNPSLAQLQAEKAMNMQLLRQTLNDVNIKDLVPTLVARHVIRSYEMGAVYSQEDPILQMDKLIEILKSKTYFVAPLVDALIRNGRTEIAQSILAQLSTSGM
ncbi:CARD domain-containing protein [Aphelenchoides fujianensis]|nr:CARD domain-containing protein [Aphelenchoides fujianensis]